MLILLCYYTGHFQMIFLVSILIPIPKGPRVDVRKTQNYRAIELSCILCKILNNIIITSQRNVIKTSDLQFGYKSNCSTIMCSTLVIETIQYFTQMQSPVYVLFIDASKHLIDCVILNYSIYYPSETCVHWLDVYFLTCMVTNNSRYDGITVYLLCTK